MSNKYNIKLFKDDKLEKEYKEIKVLDNNEIKFYIDSTKNIIGSNFFTRENKDFKFHIDFDKKKYTYLLKEKNMLFDIKVKKAKIEKKDNKIDILYQIETAEEKIRIVVDKI